MPERRTLRLGLADVGRREREAAKDSRVECAVRQRLQDAREELLRQLASAAFAVGNFELKAKFDDASAKIKRDIVFAASLYL